MSSHSTGCPFCEIASGLDQSVELVCEGPDWVAFFPSDPATPGHTLIIPRSHIRDFWSADAALASELARAAQRIGNAIQDALSPGGMNLITSAGEAAEQTVFHLHLHVVPRWPDDALDIWPPKHSMDAELKEDLADAIRRSCSGE